MDFLKFINSNAVRNHLQELEYQPTAMEAAWLVYQCETLSQEEKYAAWQEIIDTMPDCPSYRHTAGLKQEYEDSTHAFLRAYIAQQKKLTSVFLQTDDSAIYKVQYQFVPNGEQFLRHWCKIDGDFPTLTACLQAVPQNNGDVKRIVIKQYNTAGAFLMAARFLPDHRLAAVEPKSGSLYAIENMEFDEWALYSVFHMVHLGSGLHFPLPFQPNDLLYSPGNPDATEPTITEGVFIAEWPEPYHTERGFFQHKENPNCISCLVPPIMNCEYCPPEVLTKQQCLLSRIYNLLKTR